MDERKVKEEQTERELAKITVPEVTVEAAMKKAHRIARRLRASNRRFLTSGQLAVLQDNANELNQVVEESPIMVDVVEIPVIEVCKDCCKTVDSLDNFVYACNNVLNETTANKKQEASDALRRLADKVECCKDVDLKKVKAHIDRILAFSRDEKTDLNEMRRMERSALSRGSRSMMDRTILSLMNSNRGIAKELGVSNSTKLYSLTLGELINITNRLRGIDSMSQE